MHVREVVLHVFQYLSSKKLGYHLDLYILPVIPNSATQANIYIVIYS